MSNAVPDNFEVLEKIISERYESLSRRLKQTARYLLDHPQEVALSTVAQLSGRADVTPSTLIRFANTFGFSGFSEMQGLFRDRLFNDLPNYADRISVARQATGENPEVGQLLGDFASANRSSLEQLPHTVDVNQLERALDIFEQAGAIHVLGTRRSFPVASYFAYALRHVGKRTFLIDGLGGMYPEQARLVEPGDALFAISYSPYARESTETAAAISERGIPVVAISDSTLSPLSRMADVAFSVQEAEVRGFRSLTASMCLAQTLAIGLGVRRDRQAS